MLVSAVQQSESITHISPPFLDSIPIQVITEYWVAVPVLHSRSSLVIYWIYSSVYMWIWASQLIPPCFSPFGNHMFVFYTWNSDMCSHRWTLMTGWQLAETSHQRPRLVIPFIWLVQNRQTIAIGTWWLQGLGGQGVACHIPGPAHQTGLTKPAKQWLWKNEKRRW